MRAKTRGTAVVSHVLAIGISSLLIVGLLFSAGTLLNEQRDASAEQELETIGNRMATQLAELDEVNGRGLNVSVRSTHPPRIAGRTYTVQVRDGSDCETETMAPDTCLVLSSAALSVTEVVPIRTKSTVAVESLGSGTFRLHSTTTDSTSASGGLQSLRPGVGRDFTVATQVSDGQNQQPVPRFTIDPGAPDSSNDITFDGSGTVDDGRIVNYTWYFGNGDQISSSKPRITYDYDHEPGYYDVWLNVTDDDGATVKTDRNITVAGLEYNRDLTVGADNDISKFTMTNNWSSHPVTITSILIDTPNDIDELGSFFFGAEVTIQSDTDSSTVEPENTQYGRDVPNDGIIVPGFDTTVQPGDDVTITVDDYGRDISGDEFSFSVRHQVDGQSNVTRFTDVVGSLEIKDFYLEESGTDLDAVLITNQDVGTVEVEWDRLFTFDDGTLTESDFSQDASLTDTSQNRYAYRTQVNNEFGLHYVVLREAKSTTGLRSGEVPIYRLEYVSTLYD